MIYIHIFSDRIGLIYRGPHELFNYVFSSVYSYVDVITPPSTDTTSITIDIQGNEMDFKFGPYFIRDKIENLDSVLRRFFLKKRSIMLVANKCVFLDENNQEKSFILTEWGSIKKIKIKRENKIFEIRLDYPFGDNILSVPRRWIKVILSDKIEGTEIEGNSVDSTLLYLPPGKFKLKTPYETFILNTQNATNTMYVKLSKEFLEKVYNYNDILFIFQLKNGISLGLDDKNIWIPNSLDDNIRESSEGVFLSNYGLVKSQIRGIKVSGIPVFAFDDGRTLYLLFSSGKFFSLGLRQIYRDFMRAPAYVEMKDEKIDIITYGKEEFVIDLKIGGIKYLGKVDNLKVNIQKFFKYRKVYELGDRKIEITTNEVKIYKRKRD